MIKLKKILSERHYADTWQYPVAKRDVGGLKVIPNELDMEAVYRSIREWNILENIREVQLNAIMSSADETRPSERKVEKEYQRLMNTREVSPLIVGVDRLGAFIVKGLETFYALKKMRVKSFPAWVVLDVAQL